MKFERNKTCPCGSGKKYKHCCLNKTEEAKMAEALVYSMQSLEKVARIKQCLHPNKQECASKIVKAHAVQNNRILIKIAEKGHVITNDGVSNLIFQDSQKKGRKIATTFTGFCSYHDKVLFQKIEDFGFISSQEQVFLFTYRTMSWHYHKKQEQLNANNILCERMSSLGYSSTSSKLLAYIDEGLKLGVEDNEKEKVLFDKYLLNKDYSTVNFCIWELPYEIEFTISMMHELEYDIKGQLINNLETDVDLKKMYLNIFPGKDKSFCIWSWLTKNNDVYIKFAKQFMELDVKERENYLNNKIPRWSDSLIISPRLWESWGRDIQEALIVHGNFEIFYRAHEKETKDHKYTYMDTPWNLFEEL